VGISWGDAAAYCDWLSQKINLPFKLPTEAQWEKAARGTNHRKYPWGNREPDRNLANFNSIIDRYTPVGSYPEGASPYGVLDMAGNVWDWCWDWYNPKYYKKSPPKNPTGPKKASNYGRVLRGGGCNDPAIFLCCSTHISYGIDTRRVDVGFRLSQDIK
jgi:formylglycine-generating enzyme required for sulfatase activity